MPKSQKMAAGTAPVLPTLPPKRPQDTQTAWEDPWAAARTARRELADAEAIGHRITEEINADPAEAARLRRARKNARAGKTYPRHSDTK